MTTSTRRADPEHDIRAFLQRDRERIVRAVRKRIAPHLQESTFYKANGARSRLWLDQPQGQTARSTPLNGFVLKSICGIEDEGALVLAGRHGDVVTTVKFADLPYEDLMKVSKLGRATVSCSRAQARPRSRHGGLCRHGARSMRHVPLSCSPGHDRQAAHLVNVLCNPARSRYREARARRSRLRQVASVVPRAADVLEVTPRC